VCCHRRAAPVRFFVSSSKPATDMLLGDAKNVCETLRTKIAEKYGSN
jgi:hypothetical protein